MKTEHEKLKEIIDLIEYNYKRFKYLEETKENEYYNWNTWFCIYYKWTDKYNKVDVREIIFNPEFRDKFIEYWLESGDYDWYETYKDIWKYLDDPVTYLYNLLELWNH